MQLVALTLNVMKWRLVEMLITNGYTIWGTAFDAIDDVAPKLSIGDSLAFGKFIPKTDVPGVPIRFPMIWHVIDKQGSNLKLLSYFFFEHCFYQDVRQRLNEKYFNECFTPTEQDAILTTDVITKTGDSYVVTQDKLYVPALEDIVCIPEHLKIGTGLHIEDEEIPSVEIMYCFYWLRNPGLHEDENLVVQGYVDSEIVLDSVGHDADEVGVRAVMWVDTTKFKPLRFW